MSDWRITFMIVSGLIVVAAFCRMSTLAQRAGTLGDVILSVVAMGLALLPMCALLMRYLGVVA